MKKDIKAIFDFDNTITTKDTLFDFIRFYHGTLKFIWGIFVLSPILLLFICKLMSNGKAKEKMFAFYFKGEKQDLFLTKCQAYSKQIDTITNIEAINRIKWHQQQGHEVLIVSASIEDWIKPWAKNKNIKSVIGTKIECKDNRLTGRFSTSNCNGIEKTKRFLALYPNRETYELFVYGDSSGDREILSLSDHPFFRTFK